nr:aldehyde oxidase GLOX1-like [Ipomoea batatas]
MPFGLKNSGSTYTRIVARLFKSLIGKSTAAYVDDMLVKKSSFHDTPPFLISILSFYCIRWLRWIEVTLIKPQDTVLSVWQNKPDGKCSASGRLVMEAMSNSKSSGINYKEMIEIEVKRE